MLYRALTSMDSTHGTENFNKSFPIGCVPKKFSCSLISLYLSLLIGYFFLILSDKP